MGAGLVEIFLPLPMQVVVEGAAQRGLVHGDPAQFSFERLLQQFMQLSLVKVGLLHRYASTGGGSTNMIRS